MAQIINITDAAGNNVTSKKDGRIVQALTEAVVVTGRHEYMDYRASTVEEINGVAVEKKARFSFSACENDENGNPIWRKFTAWGRMADVLHEKIVQGKVVIGDEIVEKGGMVATMKVNKAIESPYTYEHPETGEIKEGRSYAINSDSDLELIKISPKLGEEFAKKADAFLADLFA